MIKSGVILRKKDNIQLNNLEQSYDPVIDNLLKEYSDSRKELSRYMESVDGLREKVNSIFPETTDFRNRFVLEEKIKAASSFFSTLLNIRQEYNKSIKEEIELRRKLFTLTQEEDLNEDDIRDIADMIEEHVKKSKPKKKSSSKNSKKELEDS